MAEKDYEEFTVRQDAIFDEDNIPQEFRGWFAAQAWEEGHSCGYDEVLNLLRELTFTFQRSIKEYTERIRSEAT